MSNKLMEQLKVHADRCWDKAREAEPGQGGGIRLDKGNYVGLQTWELTAVKSGKTKGATVILETITVDSGPEEGESVNKRFPITKNKFKNRDGVEQTQAEQSFEALAKRLKESYPDQSADISKMSSSGLLDMLQDCLDGEHRVKFMVDEFTAKDKDGNEEQRKFYKVLGPVDDADGYDDSDEEYEDEEEEEEELEDEEGGADEDEEEAALFERGDTVLWTSPRSSKQAEFEVTGVQKAQGTVTLKSSRGKTFKAVPDSDVELVE